MKCSPLQLRSIFKPSQLAEQSTTYWDQTRGWKTVLEWTKPIANLKSKSERRKHTTPAFLGNCQQKTGCLILLLNQAVTEAEEQKSPSHEVKAPASQREGHYATGLLHPILCNSIPNLGETRDNLTTCHTEMIISRSRERRGIKIIFPFGGCQGTWPTIPQ